MLFSIYFVSARSGGTIRRIVGSDDRLSETEGGFVRRRRSAIGSVRTAIGLTGADASFNVNAVVAAIPLEIRTTIDRATLDRVGFA